jgi:hypothetical protein
MDTQYWRHRTARGDVCKGLLAGFVACWDEPMAGGVAAHGGAGDYLTRPTVSLVSRPRTHGVSSGRGWRVKVASGAPRAQAESRDINQAWCRV